jgi:hypothetical protein
MIRNGKTASTQKLLGITNVHNVSVADAIFDSTSENTESNNINQA